MDTARMNLKHVSIVGICLFGSEQRLLKSPWECDIKFPVSISRGFLLSLLLSLFFSGRKYSEHKSSGKDFKLGVSSLRIQAR